MSMQYANVCPLLNFKQIALICQQSSEIAGPIFKEKYHAQIIQSSTSDQNKKECEMALYKSKPTVRIANAPIIST